MILLKLVVSVLLFLGENAFSSAEKNAELSSSGGTMASRFTEAKDGGPNSVEIKMKTTMGTLIGLQVPSAPPHVVNSQHYAFRGIPYAKSPVGELRFSDPIDFEGTWQGGFLNATKFGSICPQYDPFSDSVYGSEDCLFLNVFTPYLRGTDQKENTDKLLPVLFWIHGGAYIRGSANPFGVERLLSRNLIVVTTNYRLGALGFLSTSDSMLPGNYGILDQASALRWVKRHISEFGGDPNQITIAGFSAGSSSTNLHLYSPLTKDLVNQAILMSGASTCDWAIQERPEEAARLLAAELSCPTAPSVALSSCVKAKDVEEIVRAQFAIHKLEFYPGWFAPIVDGGLRPHPFLPAPLDELTIHSVPSIMGKVPNEALMFALNSVMLHADKTNASALYDAVAPVTFTLWNDPETFMAMNTVAQNFYYSSHARTSKDLLVEGFTNGATDTYFHVCIDDMANHLATSGSPVYAYIMTHRDPESPVWARQPYEMMWKMGYTSRMLEEGISHGDDLVYIFSLTIAPRFESERDQHVSDILTSLVANFIMTGKPQTDLPSLTDIPVWEPVKPGLPLFYYDISPNPVMVQKFYNQEGRNFWTQVIPAILSTSTKSASESQGLEDSFCKGRSV
ncbi:carboxylic ester hydrolase-like isoform X2 [Palaemon carinicauda]|uniref:carboxylic ester hydrolase-like isoform X2 n=1 Tax=Palaemon carinicauda TaxID=392227 RepID=UPI0035B5B571